MDFNFRTGFRIVNLLMLIAATGISVSMCVVGMMKRKFAEDKGIIFSGVNDEAGVSCFLPETVLQNI